VLAETGSAAFGPVVLVDGERTVMDVVEGRVEVGDAVELVQTARVSAKTAKTAIPIPPSLRTVIIVSPITLSDASGGGHSTSRMTWTIRSV